MVPSGFRLGGNNERGGPKDEQFVRAGGRGSGAKCQVGTTGLALGASPRPVGAHR